MLFDLFGDFAIEGDRGGAIRLTAIVRLGQVLGLSDTAIRAAAGRMVQDGWLIAERQGRESIYALTVRGRQLVDEGRERIFAEPDEAWDGTWYLLMLTVPEARREIRDRMREELSWLGFGSPANAVYVSPRDHRRVVERLAAELDSRDYLQMYRGVALLPVEPVALVARAWGDLGPVNQRYGEFLEEFTPRLALVRSALAAGTFEDRTGLSVRFRLANRFRKCLFDDPGLPRELLPGTWWGFSARRLFLEFHALVSPAALRYFDATCARPASKPSAS
jgi:phenylacetic acid degradation operon negative regulatory protein